MSRLCLVDFDDTLILTDSLRTVMDSEHWLYSPSLFAAGVKLFFCRAIRRGEAKARDRFKAGILRRFKELPEEKVSDYVAQFKGLLNTGLTERIAGEHYDRIIVISASEENLVRRVLDGVLDKFEVIANTADPSDDFRTCYGEEKVRRTVYTDSYSDRPLMQIANTSFLVKGRTVAKAEFWEVK